jgi:hypothetical protein
MSLSRILDWFWLGSRARELRARAGRFNPRAEVLAMRARMADAIARQALAPPEPYEESKPDAVVCELFRQSIHWSLEARRELEPRAESESTPASAESEESEKFAREIVGRSFEDLAELGEREQTDLVEKLGECSRALLEPLVSKRLEARRLWVTRAIRIGMTSLAVVLGITYGAKKLEDWRDLARGRPWKASSEFPQAAGCKSPEQMCSESPGYFFHTAHQESPSIEFDLGETKTISAVVVQNRADCCAERAIPLVVEVSEKPGEWREVRRRTKDFKTWHGRFPATPARSVRLSVPRGTFLHLLRVKILP